MSVTDDASIHEVSRRLAYRSTFDGITRCGRVFFWRHSGPHGKLIQFVAGGETDKLTPDEVDWFVGSLVDKVPSCVGCLGAEP